MDLIGPAAKGAARREELLHAALDIIGRDGIRAASVRELASAVGLTPAAVLHHFGSKENLFVAVLKMRDEMEIESERKDPPMSGEDHFVRAMRRNSRVPGLIHLFSQLSVDAADPDHAAHDYFVERGLRFRSETSASLAKEQAAGNARTDVVPEDAARLVQAVSDGLQLQWLLDPTIDMAALSALFLRLFDPSPEGTATGTDPAEPFGAIPRPSRANTSPA